MSDRRHTQAQDRQSLRDLALVFLRLGLTAFGGPAAHIAMMRREFVEIRGWLSDQEFLDIVGAASLIPGPNSTEVAIFIGGRRAARMGLLLAGVCFILPAMLLVGALAWAYVRFGTTPAAQHLLYGVEPVIVAIVVQALIPLLRATLKGVGLGVCGALAAVGAALGVYPLAVVFGGGVVTGSVAWLREKRRESLAPLGRLVGLVALFVLLGLTVGGHSSGRAPFGMGSLFAFFLKVGSVLYGSGYVLLAYLNSDLVTRLGWLTRRQLLDAVAIGQFTPGPVFTTATFIGYLKGGPLGAVVATVGIFLPSFLFVGLSGRVLPGLRKSPLASAFMNGVNVSSLAIMAVVCVTLARTALVDALTVGIAIVSLALLLRFRLNSAWLILAGSAAGFLRHAL